MYPSFISHWITVQNSGVGCGDCLGSFLLKGTPGVVFSEGSLSSSAWSCPCAQRQFASPLGLDPGLEAPALPWLRSKASAGRTPCDASSVCWGYDTNMMETKSWSHSTLLTESKSSPELLMWVRPSLHSSGQGCLMLGLGFQNRKVQISQLLPSVWSVPSYREPAEVETRVG